MQQELTALNKRRRGKGLANFVEDENGCWIWQGYMAPNGYGRLGRGLVYRTLYEGLVGVVPDGLELDHLCRVRACVNPEHLEPVTHRVNSRRGDRTKLTEEQVIAIKSSDSPAQELADRFGVTRTCIYYVRRGERWDDIGPARRQFPKAVRSDSKRAQLKARIMETVGPYKPLRLIDLAAALGLDGRSSGLRLALKELLAEGLLVRERNVYLKANR